MSGSVSKQSANGMQITVTADGIVSLRYHCLFCFHGGKTPGLKNKTLMQQDKCKWVGSNKQVILSRERGTIEMFLMSLISREKPFRDEVKQVSLKQTDVCLLLSVLPRLTLLKQIYPFTVLTVKCCIFDLSEPLSISSATFNLRGGLN